MSDITSYVVTMLISNKELLSAVSDLCYEGDKDVREMFLSAVKNRLAGQDTSLNNMAFVLIEIELDGVEWGVVAALLKEANRLKGNKGAMFEYQQAWSRAKEEEKSWWNKGEGYYLPLDCPFCHRRRLFHNPKLNAIECDKCNNNADALNELAGNDEVDKD